VYLCHRVIFPIDSALSPSPSLLTMIATQNGPCPLSHTSLLPVMTTTRHECDLCHSTSPSCERECIVCAHVPFALTLPPFMPHCHPLICKHERKHTMHSHSYLHMSVVFFNHWQSGAHPLLFCDHLTYHLVLLPCACHNTMQHH
jgi:hypothetical protein